MNQPDYEPVCDSHEFAVDLTEDQRRIVGICVRCGAVEDFGPRDYG